MPSIKNELNVCRLQLGQAFRIIKKLSGFGDQSAVLTFQNERLKIQLGGCELTADAEGRWHGQVKVPVDMIRRIAKAFKKSGGKNAVVSTNGRELRIDQIVVSCHWDALVYPRISMPLGATLTDVLSLPLKYSLEDIDRSELAGALASAEAKMHELIAKAVWILQPLNVGEDHLRELVNQLLNENVKRVSGVNSGEN
jgi:hypothetical protein